MPKRHPVLISFGLNVRKHREANGLTQESLAEKADLDRSYMTHFEKGKLLRHAHPEGWPINHHKVSSCHIKSCFCLDFGQIIHAVRLNLMRALP